LTADKFSRLSPKISLWFPSQVSPTSVSVMVGEKTSQLNTDIQIRDSLLTNRSHFLGESINITSLKWSDLCEPTSVVCDAAERVILAYLWVSVIVIATYYEQSSKEHCYRFRIWSKELFITLISLFFTISVHGVPRKMTTIRSDWTTKAINCSSSIFFISPSCHWLNVTWPGIVLEFQDFQGSLSSDQRKTLRQNYSWAVWVNHGIKK